MKKFTLTRGQHMTLHVYSYTRWYYYGMSFSSFFLSFFFDTSCMPFVCYNYHRTRKAFSPFFFSFSCFVVLISRFMCLKYVCNIEGGGFGCLHFFHHFLVVLFLFVLLLLSCHPFSDSVYIYIFFLYGIESPNIILYLHAPSP